MVQICGTGEVVTLNFSSVKDEDGNPVRVNSDEQDLYNIKMIEIVKVFEEECEKYVGCYATVLGPKCPRNNNWMMFLDEMLDV